MHADGAVHTVIKPMMITPARYCSSRQFPDHCRMTGKCSEAVTVRSGAVMWRNRGWHWPWAGSSAQLCIRAITVRVTMGPGRVIAGAIGDNRIGGA